MLDRAPTAFLQLHFKNTWTALQLFVLILFDDQTGTMVHAQGENNIMHAL